ncbi:MAG: hypothetical protein QXF17_01065 [Ignisphaera sp.]
MPMLNVHMLSTFTISSTILKHLFWMDGLQILLNSIVVMFSDVIIDLGHGEEGRSWITHSVASAPIVALTPYIMLESLKALILPGTLQPIQQILDIFYSPAIVFLSIINGFMHLFWDSLTTQGIHVPGIGWVSLIDTPSIGFTANIIPISASLMIIYFFWCRV